MNPVGLVGPAFCGSKRNQRVLEAGVEAGVAGQKVALIG